MESPPTAADIEVLESWYPVLITERRVRPGVNGPGTYRAGGGAQIEIKPYKTGSIKGQMLGIREWLPLEGAAGGFPGPPTQFLVRRADGSSERISNKAADVIIREDETFVTRCASGGGVGDPLDRRIEAVGEDVAAGLITREEADAVYGVMLRTDAAPDQAATAARRSELRRDRLARATPPLRALTEKDVAGLNAGETMPLYPGVVHRGPVAYAERSGTPLAIAPHHWTDGCAVLEERRTGPGLEIIIRAYLDPATGQSLYVEGVPAGQPRSFDILPQRWTSLGAASA
jgi:N-methylhydantoinase B